MNQDASAPDCQLWLALPAALEQEAVDALLAGQWLIADLLVLAGDTPLALAPPLSAIERVRGRSRRALVLVITRVADVEPVLASLNTALNGARLDWWSAPILASGRLGGGES